MKKRIWIKIYGDVQGIGFRYRVREKVESLGVFGYVKNRSDGTVEIKAEGEEEVLKELLDFAHQGPRMARVDKVDYRWEENRDEFNNFNISY